MGNMEKKVGIIIGVLTLAILGVTVVFLTRPERSVDLSRLRGENEQVKGTMGAANVIVEFADYECPACATSAPILSGLVEKHGDKVLVVYRHFPIPGHKWSKLAALAAEAAGKQGKFWEMNDKLFATQEEWADKNEEPREFFEGLAEELGLDKDKFKADVDSKEVTEKVTGDLADGVALGVSATPTFFVNGEEMVGGRSLTAWEELLKL